MPLAAPIGIKTRPTTDRAKEGLFNIISHRVRDARFLDLFCGSGQIGIEALSRGAELAVFVDSCPNAVSALLGNLAKTGFASRSRYYLERAETAILRLGHDGERFGVVFMDPPYGAGFVEETLGMLAKSRLLVEEGLLVVESFSKVVDNIPSSLYLIDARAYGTVHFLFFEQREAV